MPRKTIADARERARRPAPGPRRGSQARVLRIIAGTWRGRRLRFPAQAAIRPTPDRVRETLFNWLGGAVAGARCLDLFAGSGALGLEALSRGAASVDFIERDAVAARELGRLLEDWGAGPSGTGRVQRADALAWLAERPMAERQAPFDIVFLDPPFDSDVAHAAAERLERRGWLAERALIYLEHASRAGLPAMPARWAVRKSGRAGEVGYHLLERVLERATT
ncbi:MAG: 16S rRNA (guanine(966)-N(2))-methyltransferase RsmD [Steroidobacteraceae bacterium]